MPNPPSSLNPFSYLPHRFPLALNTLKSAVEHELGESVEVKIYDQQQAADFNALKKYMESGEFNLVGFSIPIGQEGPLRGILDYIYKHIPPNQCPHIVLGNSFPTYKADALLRDYPEVLIVCGEGEDGLNELIKCLKDNRPIRNVPNLAYMDGDNVRIPTIIPICNIDIPVPATINLKKTVGMNGVVQLEASRGCSWGKCTFCNRLGNTGGWRGFPVSTVIKTLKHFHKMGVQRVAFADEDFIGSNTDRVSDLAKAIIDENIPMSYWVSLKVQDVYSEHDPASLNEQKKEALFLLKQAGVSIIFLGGRVRL